MNLNERIDRKQSNSIKWDFVTNMYPGLKHEVLPLWVADMDFPCSEEILKDLRKRVDSKIFGYSELDTEYYEIINNWFKDKYNYEVKEDEVFYSPGVVPALGAIVRAFTEKGDGIIIQQPVYYPFKNMIVNNERALVNNGLVEKNGNWEIDFKDLEEKARDPKNKMFIFCSPHNPVGRVWKKEEVSKIIKICKENDIYLISDEIHCDLIRKGQKFTSAGTFKEEVMDKLIICTAPSKTFNLAGLQLSNIIIFNKELKEKWTNETFERMGIHIPSPFAIDATKAAYTKGEKWLEEVKEYIDSNFIYIEEYLKEHLPKVKYKISEGTYLAWLDFENYDISGEELTDRLLNVGKVAFDEGILFGEKGKKSQRINVACPRSILEDAMDRVKKSLAK